MTALLSLQGGADTRPSWRSPSAELIDHLHHVIKITMIKLRGHLIVRQGCMHPERLGLGIPVDLEMEVGHRARGIKAEQSDGTNARRRAKLSRLAAGCGISRFPGPPGIPHRSPRIGSKTINQAAANLN